MLHHATFACLFRIYLDISAVWSFHKDFKSFIFEILFEFFDTVKDLDPKLQREDLIVAMGCFHEEIEHEKE